MPAPDLVLATENRLFRIIGNFLVQSLKVISIKLILFDIFIQIALIDIFVFKLNYCILLIRRVALLAFLQ